MKHSIVFLDALTFGPFDISGFSMLGDFQAFPSTGSDQVLDRIQAATMVITNKVVLGREHFEACPTLKLICITATGTNNVDLTAAREHGIVVCNVPDYASQSVAEHTLALYFALNHRLFEYDQVSRSGEWGESPVFCKHIHQFRQISQTKWLVVGYGQMGKAMTQLLKKMGFDVVVTSRHAKECAVPLVDLQTGIAEADVVSLHTSLSPVTYHLFSDSEFAAMKPSAFLINVCRGECVDSQALLNALNSGQISAAACDVWHPEPPGQPPHDELLNSLRLILTPHMAWTGQDAVNSCYQVTCRNIEAFLSGGSQNVVT